MKGAERVAVARSASHPAHAPGRREEKESGGHGVGSGKTGPLDLTERASSSGCDSVTSLFQNKGKKKKKKLRLSQVSMFSSKSQNKQDFVNFI